MNLTYKLKIILTLSIKLIFGVKGVRGESLSEFVNKGNFVTKILFQIRLDEVLKYVKIYLLIYVKSDVKQEIKELVAVFYSFFHKTYLQNLK